MLNTLNGLDENYIFIDGKCLNNIFEEIHGSNNIFEWLVSSLCVENIAELKYVKELVDRQISCNFPLLVCSDDLDFSCTVVVVKVEYVENLVLWKRFGFVRRDENFLQNYRESGIRDVEKWTDEDWRKYGSIAYDLLNDEYFFEEWCSKNWFEETYRRTWGYYHAFFNNDENIEWVGDLSFKFCADEYKKIH